MSSPALSGSSAGSPAHRAVELDPIRNRLAGLARPPAPADVAAAMRAEGLLVTDTALLGAVEALRRESIGAGPLDPLLRRPGVTDVLVNGPHEVYVDCGAGLELTAIRFADEEEVRRLAYRLAALVGRRLDDSSPFVDARLPDGTRIHAALGVVASPGTCLSLRVPAARNFSLADCVAAASLPPAGAEVLRGLIEAKLAFLVSGGTGSGKTTLLAALLALVPHSERIVVIEDSQELAPDHPHVVHLEGRPPNSEQAGAITLTDLVRQSLRMRPDRLVVGEVRGAEITDLLTAMNTGHEGGCGTIHANSAPDVVPRLEALAALSRLDRAALQAQAAAALDAVVHVRRDRDGRRRVAGIFVLTRSSAAELQVEPALEFPGDGSIEVGPGAGRLDRMLSR